MATTIGIYYRHFSGTWNHIQSLFVMLHKKVFLWSFFPPSQVSWNHRQNKKQLSGFVQSIYISLKTQYKPPSDKKQNWQSSSITHPPFMFFHTCPHWLWNENRIKRYNYNGSNETFFFLFFSFYSSINQYNLVEWFWYKIWLNPFCPRRPSNQKATLLQRCWAL